MICGFPRGDDSSCVFIFFRVDDIKDTSRSETQVDESFLAVNEPVIDPDNSIRILKSRDRRGEGETVFPPVYGIFRRIPDVTHGIMVRLSRSRVNSVTQTKL